MTRLLLPFTALLALTTACTDGSPNEPDPSDDGDDMVDPEPSDDSVDPDVSDDSGDDQVDPDGILARIELSAPVISLEVDQTLLLSVEAYDTNGHWMPLPTLTWRSSAPAILEVSAAGQLTARAPGTARITASASGVTGALDLGVHDRIATVARVVIAPIDGDLLEVGATAQLTATAYDTNDNLLPDRVITWRSESPYIAQVSASGRITALNTGTTHVVATCEGVAANLGVTVLDAVHHVAIEGTSSVTLYPQTTHQLAAVAYDALGNVLPGRAVTFSGGHPTVAHVSGTGLVTAVGNGTTTVTATIGSAHALVSIKVQTIATLQLNRTSAIIDTYDPLQLRVTAFDTNNQPVLGSVTWTSNAPDIASVDGSGLVVGHAVGEATVTAQMGPRTVSAVIIVATWDERELTAVNGEAVPAMMVEYSSTLGGDPSTFRMDLDGGVLATRAYDERYEMIVYGPVFVNGEEVGYHSFVSAGVTRFDASTQTYRFIPDGLTIGEPITGRPVPGGLEVTWQPDPQGAPAKLVFSN